MQPATQAEMGLRSARPPERAPGGNCGKPSLFFCLLQIAPSQTACCAWAREHCPPHLSSPSCPSSVASGLQSRGGGSGRTSRWAAFAAGLKRQPSSPQQTSQGAAKPRGPLPLARPACLTHARACTPALTPCSPATAPCVYGGLRGCEDMAWGVGSHEARPACLEEWGWRDTRAHVAFRWACRSALHRAPHTMHAPPTWPGWPRT